MLPGWSKECEMFQGPSAKNCGLAALAIDETTPQPDVDVRFRVDSIAQRNARGPGPIQFSAPEPPAIVTDARADMRKTIAAAFKQAERNHRAGEIDKVRGAIVYAAALMLLEQESE
jgi:hypothetical protein